MNGCYKYNKLLWNLILYYEYGTDSCVSYAEADGCTLDVLPTKCMQQVFVQTCMQPHIIAPWPAG